MKRPGFSLIEMMIAVTIVGLALVGLLSVTTSSLQVVRTIQELDTAGLLLDRLEVMAPLQLDELEETEEEGNFDEFGYPEHRWRRVVEIYGVEEDELYRITETIIWETRGEVSEQEVSYLLHRPSAEKEGFVDEEATGWDL